MFALQLLKVKPLRNRLYIFTIISASSKFIYWLIVASSSNFMALYYNLTPSSFFLVFFFFYTAVLTKLELTGFFKTTYWGSKGALLDMAKRAQSSLFTAFKLDSHLAHLKSMSWTWLETWSLHTKVRVVTFLDTLWTLHKEYTRVTRAANGEPAAVEAEQTVNILDGLDQTVSLKDFFKLTACAVKANWSTYKNAAYLYFMLHKIYFGWFYAIFLWEISVHNLKLKFMSHPLRTAFNPQHGARFFNPPAKMLSIPLVFNLGLPVLTVFLPASVALFLFLLLIDFFQVVFVRQLAIWATVGLIAFWLFSGFNFFLKRYQFGKYTSSVQRFWKRANAYFWLLEGFLFIIFFYYYLNSSQEPLYMFDESANNQQQCVSLLAAFESYLLLAVIIGVTLYLQQILAAVRFSHLSVWLLLLTAGLLILLLLETYQFYYVITKFIEASWVYSEKEQLWTQELETNRMRTKYQYLVIALAVKYWHFIFIFISWVFAITKTFEQKKLTYSALSLLSQNLLILFALNLFFYLNWAKWFIRRLYDTYYFWFFTNTNDCLFRDIAAEVTLLILKGAHDSCKLCFRPYIYPPGFNKKNMLYR